MKNKIEKYDKAIWYSFFVANIVLGANVALQYFANTQMVSADPAASGSTIFSSADLNEFIAKFYPWAVTMSAGLAVIMLMYSGYLYVTSAGNQTQIDSAKDHIYGAISGLAFLILAGLIYNTLKM